MKKLRQIHPLLAPARPAGRGHAVSVHRDVVTAIKPRTEVHDPELVAKRAGLGELRRNVGSDRLRRALAQFALRIGRSPRSAPSPISMPAAYAHVAVTDLPARRAFASSCSSRRCCRPSCWFLACSGWWPGWGLSTTPDGVASSTCAFNVAFSVWMLQSYFATIPEDLEEAAWMEGAAAGHAARGVPAAGGAGNHGDSDLHLHQCLE